MIILLDLDFWDQNQDTDVRWNVLIILGAEAFYLAKGIAAYYQMLTLKNFLDGNMLMVETGLSPNAGKIALRKDINVLSKLAQVEINI